MPQNEQMDCHNSNKSGSYQEHKKKILDGLRRSEGQIRRGGQRMVEDERYCV